ncbi:MAG: polysaccharide biosynthesis C-terminal domain-containing protein [Clostridia bacterium]|nr:polysaccharide biosynthesis C-terminal domain-containing protein [Clostridia bacterium]
MRDLTKGNIYKTFILFAIPMVLSGVLSQCYSVINTILAGKLLGDGALAAIGAISPLDTFINSISWGYGTGIGIYTAHLFGAGKFFRMKSVIVSNFFFVTAVIVLMCGMLLLFRGSIYTFLNIENAILPECDRYFMINMVGKAAVLFVFNSIYVVNAMGDSSFPFLMSVVSTVLNILVSVLSVAMFGMGVEGLALANVLSAAVVSVLYIVWFCQSFKRLGIGRHKAPLNLKVIKETAHYSIFSMLQQSVMYFSSLALSPMVNAIGGAASASYTVTLRIYDVNAAIYQNSAKTLGNYTAQCYGARQYRLLKKGLVVGFVQNVLFVLPVLLVSVFFARQVAMLFYTADAAPVSVEYTITFLRYCMPFLVCNIVANLFHHFFRGIGQMTALLVTTVVGSVARIAISWLLIGPFGIYGYYVGWVLSWVVDALVGWIIYRFGKWRKII